MKVIAVANMKGGVGKSFVASNVAALLAAEGLSVLFVDQNPSSTGDFVWPGESGESIDNLTFFAEALASEDWVEVGSKSDFIVIDSAPGKLDGLTARSEQIDHLVVVTTPETLSTLSAVATAREVISRNPKVRLSLVVNMAKTISQGKKCAQKLQKNLTFWLSAEPEFFTVVPFDGRQLAEVKEGSLFCQRFDKGAVIVSLGSLAEHVRSDSEEIGATEWIKTLPVEQAQMQQTETEDSVAA